VTENRLDELLDDVEADLPLESNDENGTMVATAKASVGNKSSHHEVTTTPGGVRRRGDSMSPGRPILVSHSAIMKKVAQTVKGACGNHRPIWLWGEPGTGREFVARFIHRSRNQGRFLAVDASAATEKEFLTELQVDPPGWLGLLDGGTLLIKEPWAQIGAVETLLERTEALPAQSRPRLIFLSPTGLDGPACSALKAILEYRGVTAINLPPLRMRPHDIPDLAAAFLADIAESQEMRPKVLSDNAVARLASFHWPGNVSQLRQVCQALTLRNPEERVLKTHHVDELIPTMEQEVALDHYSLEELVRAKIHRFLDRLKGYQVKGLHKDLMDRLERQILVLALDMSDGRQGEAAKLLGMNRTSLRRRLLRLGLTGK